jgi:hypothetical protein
MKRLALATLLLALAAPPPARAKASAGPVECQDYCAERAAASCDRIDSWNCMWYILGCLAGCNIASL